MIRYSQIENLPPNHPLVLAFEKQCKDEDDLYASAGPLGKPSDDEASSDYFDRYVAGDR